MSCNSSVTATTTRASERFISSDLAKAGDSWYAYCDNNPLQKTDPLGLAPTGYIPPPTSIGWRITYKTIDMQLDGMIWAWGKLGQFGEYASGQSGPMDGDIDRAVGGDGGGKYYIPNEPGTGQPRNLPREGGIPVPDPKAGGYPHTTLGGKVSSKDGKLYRQSAEFNGPSWPPTSTGKPAPFREIDWGAHGRPDLHPVPHQHPYIFRNGAWVRDGDLPYHR